MLDCDKFHDDASCDPRGDRSSRENSGATFHVGKKHLLLRQKLFIQSSETTYVLAPGPSYDSHYGGFYTVLGLKCRGDFSIPVAPSDNRGRSETMDRTVPKDAPLCCRFRSDDPGNRDLFSSSLLSVRTRMGDGRHGQFSASDGSFREHDI